MGSTAVVIGAGFAGLCTARVLSKHFDRVVIIEADTLPNAPAARKGAPQDHHPHTLHLRGARELEALLPGYEAELRKQGAEFLDVGEECARLGEGGWHTRAEVGVRFVAASRPLLEWVARERVLALTKSVEIREGTRVRGLLLEQASGQPCVRGVRTDHEEIRAELVIDAAGRGSRALTWLEDAGIEAPPVLRVSGHFSYSTRVYKAPPKQKRRAEWWWDLLVVDAVVPTHTRYGIISPIEGGRWLVTAGGINRDHPPRDEAGYLAFLRSLRSPIIADALRFAEPLTPVVHTRNTECIWNQVHAWNAPPRGLLLVGDGVCAPNPAYGQGITKAVVEAQLLDELLVKRSYLSKGFEKAFIKKQRKWIEPLWQLATALDLRWPGSEGKRSALAPLMAYFAGLYAAASETDPVVLRCGIEISQACAPQYAAFAPHIVARVLRHHLRPRAALPRPSVGVDMTGAHPAVLG